MLKILWSLIIMKIPTLRKFLIMQVEVCLSPPFFSIPDTFLLPPLIYSTLRKFSKWQAEKCEKNPRRVLPVPSPPSSQHLEKFQFKKVKYVAWRWYFWIIHMDDSQDSCLFMFTLEDVSHQKIFRAYLIWPFLQIDICETRLTEIFGHVKNISSISHLIVNISSCEVVNALVLWTNQRTAS